MYSFLEKKSRAFLFSLLSFPLKHKGNLVFLCFDNGQNVVGGGGGGRANRKTTIKLPDVDESCAIVA